MINDSGFSDTNSTDSHSSSDYLPVDTDIYKRIVKYLPIGMMVLRLEDMNDDRSFRLIAANSAAQRFSGIDLLAEVGKLAIDVFPGGYESGLPQVYTEVIRSQQAIDLGEVPYSDERVQNGIFAMQVFPVSRDAVCITFENITERKRVEDMMRQHTEHLELISTQQRILNELSTPLIPITNDIMVMPLIGSIDAQRAQSIIEQVLEGVAKNRIATLIIDITGVVTVDTQVANALIYTANAVRLLGAHVILTGIRPEVAQSLVGLGVNLQHLITLGTLQSGMAYALNQTH